MATTETRTKANPFQPGQRVWLAETGIQSMLFYAENGKKWECPCTWKRVDASVVSVKGEYVWLEEDGHKSVFHFSDLSLITN